MYLLEKVNHLYNRCMDTLSNIDIYIYTRDSNLYTYIVLILTNHMALKTI